jgi:hypothetical protein
MQIVTDNRTLVQTRQAVEYTDPKGREKIRKYLVIGPAVDGTWMIKPVAGDSWDYVDQQGECHNHYYQGRTRPVQALEQTAFRQHCAQTAQARLF